MRKKDNVVEFNNGNLNIKYDKQTIEEAKKDEILIFSDVLSQVDCEIFGEAYCLSNYEMGFSVYNQYRDVQYIVSYTDLKNLLKGKMVKLVAIPMDADSKEIYEEEFGN